VLATRTTVDVHWQDGRQARGAPAAAHAPCEHLDDHDFWPDDFVEEKPAVDDLDEDGALQTLTLSLNPPTPRPYIQPGLLIAACGDEAPRCCDSPGLPLSWARCTIGGLAVARLGQLCWHAACLQPGLHWCAAGAAPRPLPRTGVVLRVNAAARTAVVAWLGQAADGSLQPLEPAEAGETVSVYSIVVSCPALCILGAVFADSLLHPRQNILERSLQRPRRDDALGGVVVEQLTAGESTV